MSPDEALAVVCDTALEWAGEYGFSLSEKAEKVIRAVYVLRPESLEPIEREWAELKSH